MTDAVTGWTGIAARGHWEMQVYLSSLSLAHSCSRCLLSVTPGVSRGPGSSKQGRGGDNDQGEWGSQGFSSWCKKSNSNISSPQWGTVVHQNAEMNVA